MSLPQSARRITRCATLALAASCNDQPSLSVDPSAIVPANRVESVDAGPSAEERLARIMAGIAALGPGHDWAGTYHTYHIDAGSTLYVAPDSGWLREDFNQESRSVVDYGQLKLEHGRIAFESELLGSGRTMPATMWLVPWGERRYLFDDGHCVDFANHINSGFARVAGWSEGWRRNPLSSVEGLPQPPADCPVHLFETPVEFEVLEVGTGEPYPVPRRVLQHRVVLRGGLNVRAFAGMRLFEVCPDSLEDCREHGREFKVTHVDDTTCTGTDYVAHGGTPLAPGMRFSTRAPGM